MLLKLKQLCFMQPCQHMLSTRQYGSCISQCSVCSSLWASSLSSIPKCERCGLTCPGAAVGVQVVFNSSLGKLLPGKYRGMQIAGGSTTSTKVSPVQLVSYPQRKLWNVSKGNAATGKNRVQTAWVFSPSCWLRSSLLAMQEYQLHFDRQ